MPRNSRERGDVYGLRGKRKGRVSAGRGSGQAEPSTAFRERFEQSGTPLTAENIMEGYSDEEGGVLRVGGVAIHCSGSGRIVTVQSGRHSPGAIPGTAPQAGPLREGRLTAERQKKTGRGARLKAGTSAAAADAMQDYIANVTGGSEDCESLMERFGQTDLGADDSEDSELQAFINGMEGAFDEDDTESDDTGSSDSESGSSSDSDASTDSPGFRRRTQKDTGSGSSSDVSIEDICGAGEDGGLTGGSRSRRRSQGRVLKRGAGAAAAVGYLWAMQRGQTPQQVPGKKRNSSGVRGGQGGKMAPGEKGKLKRARVLAKRAARAETRGFDFSRVNEQLAEFVASGGDMMVMERMGKFEASKTQRIAALYGLRTSMQGAGRRRFVAVVATDRSELPRGDVAVRLSHLLSEEAAAVHVGARLDAVKHSRATVFKPHHGQRHSGQQTGSCGKRSAGKDSRRQWDAPSEGGEARTPAFMQPLAFVSSGLIQPDDTPVMSTAPVLSAPQAPARDLGAVLSPDTAVLSAPASKGGSSDNYMVSGSFGVVPVQMPGAQSPAIPSPATGTPAPLNIPLAGRDGGAEAPLQAASSVAAALAGAAMDVLASYLGVPAARLQEALAAAGIAGVQDNALVRVPLPPQQPASAAGSVLVTDTVTGPTAAGIQGPTTVTGAGAIGKEGPATVTGPAAAGIEGPTTPNLSGAEALQVDTKPAMAKPAPTGPADAASGPKPAGLGITEPGLSASEGHVPANVEAELLAEGMEGIYPAPVPKQTRNGFALTGLGLAVAPGLSLDASTSGEPVERAGLGFRFGADISGAMRVAAEDSAQAAGRRTNALPGTAAQPGPHSLLPVFIDGCDEPMDLSPAQERTTVRFSMSPFETQAMVKRAAKKEAKLGRRAERAAAAAHEQLPTFSTPTAAPVRAGFGAFEKHTTGFGSRIMAKWGFVGEGAGLGRADQGIAQPIRAVQRPKNRGLGAE